MFHRCELWQNHVSEGCWPDCDMLPLGKLGKGFGEERSTRFTPEEQKTMMTLWSIFGSPMMLGSEMTKLDEKTLALLTNREVLHLLSPDCKARQVVLDDDHSVWISKDQKTGAFYLALFNLKDEACKVSVRLSKALETLNLPVPEDLDTSKVLLSDLWNDTCKTIENGEANAVLAAHDCVVWKVTF